MFGTIDVPEGSLLVPIFRFIVYYAIKLTSAVNPIIYYLRTNRFRSAFRQFLKDPFGSSDLKEKPSGRNSGGKRNGHAMGDNETAAGKREALKADGSDGNQTEQKISIDQENSMQISLSIKRLPSQSRAWEAGDSRQHREGKQQRREFNPSPELHLQSSCQGREEQVLKESDRNLSKERRLANDSFQRSFELLMNALRMN